MIVRRAALIGIAAAITNGLWLLLDLRPPIWDPAWYLVYAHDVAASGWQETIDTLWNPASAAPLFVSMFAASKKLLGMAHTDRHVFLIQGLALTGIAIAASVIGKCAAGRRAVGWSAALAVFTPGIFATAHHAAPDLLLAWGVSCYAAGCVLAVRNRRAVSWLLVGALVALYSKFSAPLYLVLLFIPGWALCKITGRRLLFLGTIPALIAALPLYLDSTVTAYIEHNAVGAEALYWSWGPPLSRNALDGLLTDLEANYLPFFFGAAIFFGLTLALLPSKERPGLMRRISFVPLFAAGTAFIGLAAVPAQIVRYLLPLLPSLAAVAGAGFARAFSGRPQIRMVALLLAGMATWGSIAIHFGAPVFSAFEGLGMTPQSLRHEARGWPPHLLDCPDRRDWMISTVVEKLPRRTFVAANHPVYHPYGIAYAARLHGVALDPGLPPRDSAPIPLEHYDAAVLLRPDNATLRDWRIGVRHAGDALESDTVWRLVETIEAPDSLTLSFFARQSPDTKD